MPKTVLMSLLLSGDFVGLGASDISSRLRRGMEIISFSQEISSAWGPPTSPPACGGLAKETENRHSS